MLIVPGRIWASSAVDIGIVTQVATPVFSPVAGAYGPTQNVTITCSTPSSTIYYTTDGSDPTTGSSVYSTPIAIASTTTLKAFAAAGGLTDSNIRTGIFTINGQVATPAISPTTNTFDNDQSVTITCATPSVTIYYTTNGVDPTTSDTVYSGAFTVNATSTVKALAVRSGFTDSAIASETLTLQAAAPAFSPVAGTYGSTQNVTITTATTGAAIYYTTDGTDPDNTDTLYSGPVAIAATATLKAIAIKSGYTDSTITTGVYTISAGATNDAITITPTVTAPTTTDLEFDGITVAEGTIWAVVVPTADTAPTATEIKNGQRSGGSAAVWDDGRSVLDTNPYTVEAFGLSAVAYKAYAVHENGTNNFGTVAVSAEFTPADVTAPVLSSAEGVKTGQTTADLSVNTDTAEGELYVVVTQSATAPSAAQVKAGQDHTSTAADFADSDLAIVASGPHSFSATGLVAATTYYVYFMHEDAAGNQSTVLAGSSAFTTDSSTTTLFNLAADGTTTGMTSLFSTVLTGSQTDSDGGTDAVKVVDGNQGTSGLAAFRTALVTYKDGENNLTFKVKVNGSSGAEAWVAVRPVSTSPDGYAYFNVTDDATPDGSRVGTNDATWTSASVTSLGGGWFEIAAVLDMSGGSDFAGQFYFQLADSDSSGNTLRDGTNDYVFHDCIMSYT